MLKLIEMKREVEAFRRQQSTAQPSQEPGHRVMLLCMTHSNLAIKSSTALQLKRLLIDPLLS